MTPNPAFPYRLRKGTECASFQKAAVRQPPKRLSCSAHEDDVRLVEEPRRAVLDEHAVRVCRREHGVHAAVEADVESRCALCLEPGTKHLKADIDALFAREPDPEDPDQYPLDGYRIDVTDLAREALLLELPLRLVCSENCKGICPSCGVNRNIAPCTCQEGGERQNPFSALSELLTEDEEV